MKKALYMFIAAFAALTVHAKETIKSPHPASPTNMQNAANYAKGMQEGTLLTFIENAGQIVDQHGKQRKDVDFKLDCGDMVLFIGDGQLHYQWNRVDNSKFKNLRSKEEQIANRTSEIGNTEFYRMDVTLLGANKNAKVIAEELQQYRETYYLPQCPNGATAHSYSKIIYKDVYPNIDWVIYIAPGRNKELRNSSYPLGTGSQSLKHEFIVHPGGNPTDIRLQYAGATSLTLDDGALIAGTPLGSVRENAPYTYSTNTKEEIKSSFQLENSILTYSIDQSQIIHHKSQITIDPQLLWATYYGGNQTLLHGTAVDDAGNVYVCGFTQNLNNIATSGAFKAVGDGSADGFIVKFTPDGKRIWGTYYGGTGVDAFVEMVTSGTSIYAAGNSGSSSVATSGSHQSVLGGVGLVDGLLVKFDTSGNRQWATYYGGAGEDYCVGVDCDASGNVCIAGETSSSSGIATSTSYQPVYGGGKDLFLAKFNTAGVRQWATYYGVSALERYGRVACDASGNVYLAGDVFSSGLGTTGTHQPSWSGATAGDAMLVKFNSSGTRQWATYYGNSGVTSPGGVKSGHPAVDASGNVYMAGYTTDNSTGLSTAGSHQPACAGNQEAYLVKFSSSGTRIWGTYFGGSSNDQFNRVIISPVSSNLYVSGSIESTGMSTTGAYQTYPAGGYDISLAVFTPNGGLLRSTYFGGSSIELAEGISADNAGRVYVPGRCLGTSNNLSTAGAHQTTISTSILAAFVADTAVFIKQPYIDTVLCQGDSLLVKDTVFYGFRSSNTFTVQLSNASGSFASPVTIGTVTASQSGTIRCRIPVTTAAGTSYRIRIVASAPGFISADNYYNIRIKANLQGFSFNTNTPACEGDTIRLNGSTTSTGVTWLWTGPASYSSSNQNNKIGNANSSMAGKYALKATLNSTGCAITDTATVAVNPLPAKPTAGSNTPICFGATLNLTGNSTTGGVTYSWTGPNSFTASTQNPTRTSVTVADGGDYILTTTLNGCSLKDTETVVVYSNVPTPFAGSNSPLCIGSNINLIASNIANATYTWTGPAAFGSNLQNPTINNGQSFNAGTYTVTATVNGCTSAPATTNVILNQGPTVMIYPSPKDTICAGRPITLNATATGGGSGATYLWLRNGVAAPGLNNGATFTMSGVANNDTFSVLLTPGAGAGCTTPVNSNRIVVTVLPQMTPSVTMTGTDSGAWPGLLVNFEATPTNGGSSPKYQWLVNNKIMVGAISDKWGTTTLMNGDSVCVALYSSYECPNPAVVKACKQVKIATGIKDVGHADFSISPNPFKDVIVIHTPNPRPQANSFSPASQEENIVQLIDVYGRVVYNGKATGNRTVINTAALPSGSYVLMVTDGKGAKAVYKVVKTD